MRSIWLVTSGIVKLYVNYFAMRSNWSVRSGMAQLCVRYFAMRRIWPVSTGTLFTHMSDTSLCEVSELVVIVFVLIRIQIFGYAKFLSPGTLFTYMSDTLLCWVSDLLVLVLCSLTCQILRYAEYLTCWYWYSVHSYVRYFAMRSTWLVSISNLFTHMSDTSPCEVSELVAMVLMPIQILRSAKYLTC